MRSTLARTVLLFAGASLSFATLAATAGAQEGTASGTLTVAGKSKDGSVTSNFKLVLEGGQWKINGM